MTSKITDDTKDMSNDVTGYMVDTSDHVSELSSWLMKFFRKFGIGQKISPKHWGSRKAKELQDVVYKAADPRKDGRVSAKKSRVQLFDDLRKDVRSKKHKQSDFARVARTETAAMKVIFQLQSWKEAGVKKVKHHNNKGSVSRKTVGSRDKLYDNRIFTIDYLLSKAGEKDRIPLHPNCCPAKTSVTLKNGNKKIIDIKVGDIVKTHLGNYHKVLAIMKRFHIGWVYKYKTLNATGEHPVYHRNKWVPIKELSTTKKFFIGFVYNFEVEKDNSYIANNIKVHNCMCYYTMEL